MQETESIDEYILQHIDPESDYLKALYRDTHVKLLRPRMASGHLQGRMLKMFVKMIRPRQILEIGTYSGYSALCLAEGLSVKFKIAVTKILFVYGCLLFTNIISPNRFEHTFQTICYQSTSRKEFVHCPRSI